MRIIDICIWYEALRGADFRDFVKLVQDLSLDSIVISTSDMRLIKEIRKIQPLLETSGTEVFTRFSLAAIPQKAKRVLARVRNQVDLVSYRVKNRQQMAFACRDRRVDVIEQPYDKWIPIFRGDWRNIISLNKFVELKIYPIIAYYDVRKAANVMFLYRRLVSRSPAKGRENIILSSGAPSSKYMVSALSLEKLAEELGINTFSYSKIFAKIRENRDKIKGLTPVSGVSIYRNGENI